MQLTNLCKIMLFILHPEINNDVQYKEYIFGGSQSRLSGCVCHFAQKFWEVAGSTDVILSLSDCKLGGGDTQRW